MKVKHLHSFLIVFFIFFINKSEAQDLIYDNNVYVDYIKTVQLTLAGAQTTFPVVNLESDRDGILQLSFDDIEGGFKRYIYKLIHCDKDWNPSSLQEIEYIDGFNDEEIEDYDFSSNGYSDYTHYRLGLPNDDVDWLISGNYLLVVSDMEMQVPVLSRRFIVYEDVITINEQLIKPRDVLKINSHHEMKIELSYRNIRIDQPKLELYTTVLQNDNWNSAIYNLVGTFERGQSLILDQYDYISFPALKEFRSFDIRPLSYTTEYVTSIDQDEIETTVLLDLNKIRSERNSIFEADANGKFVIDNTRFREPNISSEYCKVIFNLESYKKYERDLYIVGEFSDWQAREEYKLEYDPTNNLYLGQAYFKQGYYNYMFALLNEDGSLDISSLEGSWYETENDYLVIVYFREFLGLYDRIFAVKKFNNNTPR